MRDGIAGAQHSVFVAPGPAGAPQVDQGGRATARQNGEYWKSSDALLRYVVMYMPSISPSGLFQRDKQGRRWAMEACNA